MNHDGRAGGEAIGRLGVDDRLELHELAARYGNIIDAGDWDALDHVFTRDAVFEQHGFGPDVVRSEGLEAIRALMEEGHPHPVAHHVTNVEVRDTGRVVELVFKLLGTGRRGRVGSADCRDVVERTASGWRISRHRTELRGVRGTGPAAASEPGIR